MNILQKHMIKRLLPWADQIMRASHASRSLSAKPEDRKVVPTDDYMKALWVRSNR